MTSYITITDVETDPEAPLTSELAKKWRDNPLAIAEGDSTAPATLLPSVLLGTLTTTSGTTQTLSSLILTPYKSLMFVVNGVTVNSGTAANPTFNIAGASSFTLGPSANLYSSLRGTAYVNLANGVGSSIVAELSAAAPSGAVAQVRALRTSLSTASTSVSVSHSGNSSTFTAGTVLVYGVK